MTSSEWEKEWQEQYYGATIYGERCGMESAISHAVGALTLLGFDNWRPMLVTCICDLARHHVDADAFLVGLAGDLLASVGTVEPMPVDPRDLETGPALVSAN